MDSSSMVSVACIQGTTAAKEMTNTGARTFSLVDAAVATEGAGGTGDCSVITK
jgi:hypothetical protein